MRPPTILEIQDALCKDRGGLSMAAKISKNLAKGDSFTWTRE